jgi:hypothetical protein
MLSGLPVHGTFERDPDGVVRNELNSAIGVLWPGSTPNSVIHDQPNHAYDAVEGPDNDRGPHVMAVAGILSVIVSCPQEGAESSVSLVEE